MDYVRRRLVLGQPQRGQERGEHIRLHRGRQGDRTGTSSNSQTVNIKLEKFDIKPYFHEMICAHELYYVKEDLQLWYMLSSKYKLDYEKTILVEDTINNIHVALSAGVSSAIYVGDEEFKPNEKILKLDSINQLLSTLN